MIGFAKKKTLPQSYKPVLEGGEVIDLFARLTLYQQAALMRLLSRNTVLNVNGEQYMGYEFDYEVEGAVISVSQSVEESD
ncbi:MAG TPA: hypothetical protein DCL66_03745 [Gammaproteobacteria bacterium]|nr:hypothetical protein [Gammaproteobacteria bacterium]|tara:strand:+ start:2759 stop:2998 length:240 start_codon:yes stop_codon:yes gene_type:complete